MTPDTTTTTQMPVAADTEGRLIAELERYVSTDDNVCYFAVALIRGEYDPSALVTLARERNHDQRLGYMAGVCAQTAEVMHLDEPRAKLTRLHTALERDFPQWQHLLPAAPDWGKRIDMYPDQLTALNRKWKIYSPLRPDEVEDFADLYITKDYARYSPLERFEMQEKGIRHTRVQRP